MALGGVTRMQCQLCRGWLSGVAAEERQLKA